MQFLQILQGRVQGLQKLITLLDSFSELDLSYLLKLYSIFLVLNVPQIENRNE